MGNLTNDMTRLRGEVDALRSAREMLMQELTRGANDMAAAVMAMRADFASAHMAMAKKTSGEREAFVAGVIQEVNSLLDSFSQERKYIARKGRADRRAFLIKIKKQVMDLREDTANDLMGARLAWCGQSQGKSRPLQPKPIQSEKELEIKKLVLPPAKEAAKKAVRAPEVKAEKPAVAFKGFQKKEAAKKAVIAPEVKAGKPAAAFKGFQKKEEKDLSSGKLTKATTKAKHRKK